jgi:hypothetical protein
VLIVNFDHRRSGHRQALEQRGFRVTETREWPDDDAVKLHEVVIVVLRDINVMTTLAARMRAKPGFGQRVLIGVSPSVPTLGERRTGRIAGFDEIVAESAASRTLLARILRRLRARPEHRCLLPDRKRSAA